MQNEYGTPPCEHRLKVVSIRSTNSMWCMAPPPNAQLRTKITVWSAPCHWVHISMHHTWPQQLACQHRQRQGAVCMSLPVLTRMCAAKPVFTQLRILASLLKYISSQSKVLLSLLVQAPSRQESGRGRGLLWPCIPHWGPWWIRFARRTGLGFGVWGLGSMVWSLGFRADQVRSACMPSFFPPWPAPHPQQI